MDQHALNLLKASIEHWRRLGSGNTLPGESLGIASCALCSGFVSFSCHGCPVNERSGRPMCLKTPYVDVSNFFNRRTETREQIFAMPAFQELARIELAFLESLLPPEEQTSG